MFQTKYNITGRLAYESGHIFVCVSSHLQAALSLWVLLVHDALLLSSLLLFPASLSSFLPLSMSLLEEVLLDAGAVPVRLQLALCMHAHTHTQRKRIRSDNWCDCCWWWR